jgi:hypothetical protein
MPSPQCTGRESREIGVLCLLSYSQKPWLFAGGQFVITKEEFASCTDVVANRDLRKQCRCPTQSVAHLPALLLSIFRLAHFMVPERQRAVT